MTSKASRNQERRQARKQQDNHKLKESIRGGLPEGGHPDVRKITSVLTEAQEISKLGGRNSCRKMAYWWNAEIESKRNKCNRIRRKITRGRRVGADDIDTLTQEYRIERNELRRLINTTKKELWKDLCSQLDQDIWGQGYKLATKQLGAHVMPYNISTESRLKIISELFPTEPDTWVRSEIREEVVPFTMKELADASANLKVGKAPGIDGIFPDTVKEAVNVAPTNILEVMNGLLTSHLFPSQWKRARVVLIPKAKYGDMQSASSYRPICLLDALGKLYELLIRERLLKEINANEGFSNTQFGFRKNKSTIQAVMWIADAVRESDMKWCALITLDIKNAFNTAKWSLIIQRLKDMGISRYLIAIIESYFCGRTIELSARHSRGVFMGVPQGSVLGPTLWNVLYDNVLRVDLPEGCKTIAYADDLALLVESNTRESLCFAADTSLLAIQRWMNENRLNLAPQKTEAVILKGPRDREGLTFMIGDTAVLPQKHVKYLGIWLDDQLNFKEHIKKTTKKAQESVSALSKIMPNIGGPSSEKRTILAGVVQSIILYGAPIWRGVMHIKKYRAMLEVAQRKALLRTVSAYRTASTRALQVVAGVVPIDLLIDERVMTYGVQMERMEETRKRAREISIDKWQQRWNDTIEVAQWTKLLIPNISRWIECRHKRTEYFLTQFLTGHGSFRVYTFRIGRVTDERCLYCGETDTPAHTVFVCNRWVRERQRFDLEFGTTLEVHNIIDQMMNSEKNWLNIHNLIKVIMRKKEEEERQLRQPP